MAQTPTKAKMRRIMNRTLAAMNEVLISEGMIADAPSYRWSEDKYIKPNIRIMSMTQDAHGNTIPYTPERVYYEAMAGHGKYERLRRDWLDQYFTSKHDQTQHRIIGLSRTNRKYPVLTMQLDDVGDDFIIYKWSVNQIVGYMTNV